MRDPFWLAKQRRLSTDVGRRLILASASGYGEEFAAWAPR